MMIHVQTSLACPSSSLHPSSDALRLEMRRRRNVSPHLTQGNFGDNLGGGLGKRRGQEEGEAEGKAENCGWGSRKMTARSSSSSKGSR